MDGFICGWLQGPSVRHSQSPANRLPASWKTKLALLRLAESGTAHGLLQDLHAGTSSASCSYAAGSNIQKQTNVLQEVRQCGAAACWPHLSKSDGTGCDRVEAGQEDKRGIKCQWRQRMQQRVELVPGARVLIGQVIHS